LDEFTEARAESLRELGELNLRPEDLAARRHPVRCGYAGGVAGDLGGHDLNHLYQIARVMAHQYAWPWGHGPGFSGDAVRWAWRGMIGYGAASRRLVSSRLVWHRSTSGSYQFAALFFLAVLRVVILETGGGCALRKSPSSFCQETVENTARQISGSRIRNALPQFRLNLSGPTSPFAAGIQLRIGYS
jgi:hypothetical protein